MLPSDWLTELQVQESWKKLKLFQLNISNWTQVWVSVQPSRFFEESPITSPYYSYRPVGSGGAMDGTPWFYQIRYNIIVFIFKKTTLQIFSRDFTRSSDILLSSYLLFCLLSRFLDLPSAKCGWLLTCCAVLPQYWIFVLSPSIDFMPCMTQ